MEKTINMILEEVNSNLQELKTLDKGSTEYGNVVSDTGKLLEKVTPMIKIKDEAEERAKNRKEDLVINEKIRKEEAEERAKIRKEEFEYKERIRKEENGLKEKIRMEEAEERARVREEDRKERNEVREEERVYKERIRVDEANERARIREEDRIERELNRSEDLEYKSELDKKKLFIEGAKVILPVGMFVIGMLDDNKWGNRLLKFEETGSLTTTMGRNFFGRFGKKKK